MRKLKRQMSEPAQPPSRTRDAIIARCRVEVESAIKRSARNLLIPWLRRRWRLAELGEGFQWGTPIAMGRGSRVGRYVYIGAGFDADGAVSIGDLTMVSTGCKIIGADHHYDQVGNPTRLAFAERRLATSIGADVWIGLRATILAGVKIGDGAVIGAESLVLRDVAPYTVVAGVPAKLIRPRFQGDELRAHIQAVKDRNVSTDIENS